MKRVMIAAPKSGSGKTVVTCALLQALKNSGWKAVSYKCGPDYIDPMFHEKVIGIPAKNLDTFFTGEEQTKKLFLRGMKGMEIAVLEGVMGLFDGLGGVREEGSSYHLAKVTKTPIVFVADAKGMGRSVISLLAGFLDYDSEHLIQGVLLNRITKGYFELLKPLIEEELKLPVLGFLPEKEIFHLESRYLGLVMPGERRDRKEQLQTAAEEFSKTICIEQILHIAESAGELQSSAASDAAATAASDINTKTIMPDCCKPVIAVAKDEAFCFYYADNLLMLQDYGAKIQYFSPLRDERLPDKCSALLIGGGYPELYAKQLSENRRMCAAVRDAAESGMPVVAECGGFMYLHTTLTDREGTSYNMAGVIPAACFYTGKLVRFGYIGLLEKRGYFLPEGATIKGHEFHYYDSTCPGTDAAAVRPVTGKEYLCMITDETKWMGFPHLYYPSNPAFAETFVRKAERFAAGS